MVYLENRWFTGKINGFRWFFSWKTNPLIHWLQDVFHRQRFSTAFPQVKGVPGTGPAMFVAGMGQKMRGAMFVVHSVPMMGWWDDELWKIISFQYKNQDLSRFINNVDNIYQHWSTILITFINIYQHVSTFINMYQHLSTISMAN